MPANRGTQQEQAPAREPPVRARVAVAAELQLALVDVLALALAGRHLRWVTTGPRAGAVRAVLERLVGAWTRDADAIAARIGALGRVPNGQAHAVAVETHVESLPARRLPDAGAVEALGAQIADAAAHVTLAERVAGRLDATSARLLADLRAELDAQAQALTGALAAPAAPAPDGCADQERAGRMRKTG